MRFCFNIILILTIILFTSSCVHERDSSEFPEGSTDLSIQLRVMGDDDGSTKASEGEYIGDGIDSNLSSIRVLVFKQSGSQECVSNNLYPFISPQKSLQFPVTFGDYHFVFIANEPSDTDVKAALENINAYSDLDEIAFPQTAFTSEKNIPMLRTIENVSVMANGKISINSGASQTIMHVFLKRLAFRLDVQLEAPEDLDGEFTGITLSNLPDKVPLTDNYTGSSAIVQSVIRTYTLQDNPEYFEDHIPSGSNVWGKRVKRIIIPSNIFAPANNESNAVKFTFNTKNKYNPDCLLMVEQNPDDYTLPKNIRLILNAVVKLPLELNIKASEWTKVNNNWNTEQIYLNTSQTEVNITDFNGARISIESNARIIRILGLYNEATGDIIWSGDIFNQLEWPAAWGKRLVYNYDETLQSGSGYMDIITGDAEGISGQYTLVLSASRYNSWEGEDLTLLRHIQVNVNRNGIDGPYLEPAGNMTNNNMIIWGSSYIGAFYKDNEVGERIISNRFSGDWWEAVVGDENIPGSGNPRDWIKISSTPSFDPMVGTDTPGDAEDYPVEPNPYINEDGNRATGKGRLYFRIGLKSKNTGATPRYGYITIRYIKTLTTAQDPPTAADMQNAQEFKIYVRQGEKEDYIMRAEDPMTINGTYYATRNANTVRKFLPYNLTAQDMLDNYNDQTKNFVALDTTRTGVYVKYPTQAGALFQWGNTTKQRRYAYYIRSIDENEFTNIGPIPNDVWNNIGFTFDPYWESSAGPGGIGYKSMLETCPPGYRRPNNGATSTVELQSTAANAAQSEFMVSLFENPIVGDAHTDLPATAAHVVRYTPAPISNATYGFYADGYFDRRPIQERYISEGHPDNYLGVSIDNARAAFKGTLFYNPRTYASLFLPNAGRRDNTEGRLTFRGASGFYMTSSLGNQWLVGETSSQYLLRNVWGFELSFKPAAVSALLTFGYSIRCVAE